MTSTPVEGLRCVHCGRWIYRTRLDRRPVWVTVDGSYRCITPTAPADRHEPPPIPNLRDHAEVEAWLAS